MLPASLGFVLGSTLHTEMSGMVTSCPEGSISQCSSLSCAFTFLLPPVLKCSLFLKGWDLDGSDLGTQQSRQSVLPFGKGSFLDQG